MTTSADQDFPTALLEALLNEGDDLIRRGIAMTSTSVQAWAGGADRFVVINARPLAARVFLVEPNGAHHEYYRETGDQLSDALTALVTNFLTTGMKELTVARRREISRRIEKGDLGLSVLIDRGHSSVQGLAHGPGADLAGSEELFRLEWLDKDEV